MAPSSFSDIVIAGLAPDGGLTFPDKIHDISKRLEDFRSLGYQELALSIMAPFIDDIPFGELERLIEKTYTRKKFGSEEITPLIEIREGINILDLANGPTLAFKDIALQFLGNLFGYILLQRDDYINIIGATSGDTGSSAEHAVLGKENINIFMLTPYGKMSPFQTAQMYSLQDSNIFNIAIKGVFDNCQDLVKLANEDKEFKAQYHIGAVNSINWARVAAQIVYYFKGYMKATHSSDEEVDFSVPTGNFGDILAGYIAKQMGLPIRRLILATNENNVLDEFFKTGIYKPRKTKDVVKTSSPSMDISKASNWERFLYDVIHRVEGDHEKAAQKTKEYMEKLSTEGKIDLNGTEYFEWIQKYSGFVSGSSTHQDRIETIRKVYTSSGETIDTHTADGVKVGMEYKEEGVPLICLATAKATKFEATIREALGFIPTRPIGLEGIEQKPQRFEVMDTDVNRIKEYIKKYAIRR